MGPMSLLQACPGAQPCASLPPLPPFFSAPQKVLCPSKDAPPLKRISAPQKVVLCRAQPCASLPSPLPPFSLPLKRCSAPQKRWCAAERARDGASSLFHGPPCPWSALHLKHTLGNYSAPQAQTGELLCTKSTDWRSALHRKHKLTVYFARKAQTSGLLCTKSTHGRSLSPATAYKPPPTGPLPTHRCPLPAAHAPLPSSWCKAPPPSFCPLLAACTLTCNFLPVRHCPPAAATSQATAQQGKSPGRAGPPIPLPLPTPAMYRLLTCAHRHFPGRRPRADTARVPAGIRGGTGGRAPRCAGATP